LNSLGITNFETLPILFVFTSETLAPAGGAIQGTYSSSIYNKY